MRIALVGAGAIGSVMGGFLAKAGVDITLVDMNKEHVDAINAEGIHISGCMNETIPAKACTPEQMEGIYDLIVHLTKQTALEASLTSCLKHMDEHSTVLVLQNGVPEDLAASVVGAERVLGGTVAFPATFEGPGITTLTAEPELVSITIGTMTGELTDRVLAVQTELEKGIKVDITRSLLGKRYTKLTDNSVFSALPTALNCTIEKVLDDEEAMGVICELGREAGRIIAKMGIEPEEAFGLKPTLANVDFTTHEERDRIGKEYWEPIYRPYKDQVASMLQDIRANRACEVDYINGKFIEKGKEFGVPTPYMSKVAEIICKLQERELSLDNAWDNLMEFRALSPSA